jgi:hypothetical protein
MAAYKLIYAKRCGSRGGRTRLAQRECRPRISTLKKPWPDQSSCAARACEFQIRTLQCPDGFGRLQHIWGSVHAAIYIGTEWPCGRYVVRRVSGRCHGPLGSSIASLR